MSSQCEAVITSGSRKGLRCLHGGVIMGLCISHYSAACRRGEVVLANGSTHYSELKGLVRNDVNR